MTLIKKNATLNIIKQICTIVFPFITFPYAARILKAENYGIYSFSASIVSYFVLIAGLGISSYAIREGARIRNNKYALSMFVNEVFSINLISTLFSYGVLFVVLFVFKGLDPYINVILILSTAILFTTLGADWINIIFEDYAFITKRYIFCQILAVVMLFITVKDEDDVILYSLSTVIATITANIANIIYIRKHYNITIRFTVSRKLLAHLIPIMVLFTNAIASTVYLNSDITVLGIIKTDYDVAVYGVSSKIYFMVKAIANAATTVIIPHVSALIEKKDYNGIKRIYSSTLGGLILVLIPASVGLFMLSKDIVLLIAGTSYTEAATPLAILSSALPFATIACLLINGILIPFRKELMVLVLTMSSAIINIGLNFVLIPLLNYNAAAITTLIAEFFVTMGAYIVIRKKLRVSIKKELFLAIICSIVIACVCMLSFWITTNYMFHIAFSMVTSIGICIIILIRDGNNFVCDFLKNCRKKEHN